MVRAYCFVALSKQIRRVLYATTVRIPSPSYQIRQRQYEWCPSSIRKSVGMGKGGLELMKKRRLRIPQERGRDREGGGGANEASICKNPEREAS